MTPSAGDWPRVADLVDRCADFLLGGTDAAVVALAERHATDLIITLDQRHFTQIQPAHCDRLRLLP